MGQDEPQKPIPTTDGKQMEGPSYSTRSKSTRISHDDDSSESRAQQRPLNRQASQGAKKAYNSAKVKNNDTTSHSVIDTNTVDEYTSTEIAFQNDLVLQSLFRVMNRSDLLSCRIVNKQWQDEATKELRRRKLLIKFSLQSQGNELSRSTVVRNICRSLSGCRTPSLLSSFQVKTHFWHDLGSTGVAGIFFTIGIQLKHLSLHLNHWGKWSSSETRSLMTDLRNLIFCQAPNLESLEIKFDFPDYFTDTWDALYSSDPPRNSNNEFLLLPNLKIFIVDGTPPPKFFADVINTAVNLRSVGGLSWTSSFIKWPTTAGGGLTSFGGFSSACLNYFLGAEGREKIHLLKSLKLQLTVDFDYQLPCDDLGTELLDNFLTEHKQNLQVESFECVSKFLDRDASSASKLVGVVNQILECSSGSLLKLRIQPATWVKDLLIIPRLPKLQEICFDCVWSSIEGLDGGGFFPQGFNVNSSFPNVSSIVLLECTASFFRLFVSRMEIEMTEPVPSIRQIIMIDAEKDDGCLPPLAIDFHHIFPNVVSVSYVDTKKYYII